MNGGKKTTIEAEEVEVNKWFRQIHRWLSIAFTLGVIVNMIAVSQNAYNNAIGVLALIPLIFLLITGLYLFALPYLLKRRAAQGNAA